ncbi:MAG: chemotaxis protein CheD [Desulfobacterales bacterium]|nr:chemotaxis protein CheD [Desulfobacterales bacterium]
MENRSHPPAVVNYYLKPGYIFMAEKPTAISAVLGSAVSVCIHDRKRNVGGMTHFQLPVIRKRRQATAMYGNVAIPTLIKMLIEDGSELAHLEAQLLGGSYNRAVSPSDIGRDNITTARRILAMKKVNLASEDTGGEKGRKVVFNTDTNEIAVLKVDKLRDVDWYPYKSDR